MRNLHIVLAALMAISNLHLYGQPAGRVDFDSGWKFHLGDLSEAEKSAFSDLNWRTLDLPHDWSIEREL